MALYDRIELRTTENHKNWRHWYDYREKIKHFRNLRSISQETLGQLSVINSATIKKYEYGIRNPKPNQLLKITNRRRRKFHFLYIEVLSKDLDTVKQSILDNSKIVKKGIREISVKIYPENIP